MSHPVMKKGQKKKNEKRKVPLDDELNEKLEHQERAK